MDMVHDYYQPVVYSDESIVFLFLLIVLIVFLYLSRK